MTGRKIVLLSDGTGNSAGKITKTNVWRTFQALDLSNEDQLAFYDDGVGTGGLKPLRMLGGVFGFGLARNVRQLYEDLCRHYINEDDRIFLFGFSRGAFTVRVLSGLIQHCGIIDRNADKTVKIWSWKKWAYEEIPVATDAGLKQAIRIAYRALRKRNDHAFFSKYFRFLRDRFFMTTPETKEFLKQYSVSPESRMAFIGVFDTVSAHGLPIDEMAIAVHNIFFPIRFPNMYLSRKVDHAVQALALDEARHSFHPLLWTERTYDPHGGEGKPDPRPHQVWFAGVHSDVGGGYANERLSLVPALWLLDQARIRAGLRLRQAALDDLNERATALGELNDSRSGLGVFYRYRPRILSRLGRQDVDGNGHYEVRIDRFKIHHSVFDRIQKTKADYAPFGIPQDYDVEPKTVNLQGGNENETDPAGNSDYETDQQRKQRAELQRNVEDLVFWRKVAYYFLTGIALAVALIPFLWLPNPGAIPTGITATIAGILAWGLGFVPVPGVGRISQFWVVHSYWFLVFLAVFLAAYLGTGALAKAIQSRAQMGWAHLAGGELSTHIPKQQWVEKWRKHSGGFHRHWTKNIFPALLVIFIFIMLPAIALWRWYLFTPFEGSSVCSYVHADGLAASAEKASLPLSFKTSDPCWFTGAELKQGREYEVKIALGDKWLDASLPADPTGLDWPNMSWSDRFKMGSMILWRRYWSEDWFALMGSIGRGRQNAFRISARPDGSSPKNYAYRFYAWRSGRFYMFVNDAINPFGNLNKFCPEKTDKPDSGLCFYANNTGTANISIREVRER